MTTGLIKPSPYPDGTYKRKGPRLMQALIIDLTDDEARAVRKGKRGCSCDASALTALGERCMGAAREAGAGSWSIYPMPETLIGIPKVYVKFHSWKEMGLCNFATPIGKLRYWWDERPLPEWMAPEDASADKDPDGHFDMDA